MTILSKGHKDIGYKKEKKCQQCFFYHYLSAEEYASEKINQDICF